MTATRSQPFNDHVVPAPSTYLTNTVILRVCRINVIQWRTYTDKMAKPKNDASSFLEASVLGLAILPACVHNLNVIYKKGTSPFHSHHYTQHSGMILVPRDAMHIAQHGLCCRKKSDCLSVRPSHASILSKRLNIL